MSDNVQAPDIGALRVLCQAGSSVTQESNGSVRVSVGAQPPWLPTEREREALKQWPGVLGQAQERTYAVAFAEYQVCPAGGITFDLTMPVGHRWSPVWLAQARYTFGDLANLLYGVRGRLAVILPDSGGVVEGPKVAEGATIRVSFSYDTGFLTIGGFRRPIVIPAKLPLWSLRVGAVQVFEPYSFAFRKVEGGV